MVKDGALGIFLFLVEPSEARKTDTTYLKNGYLKSKKREIMQKDPAGTRRMLSRAGERINRDVLIHKEATHFPFMLLFGQSPFSSELPLRAQPGSSDNCFPFRFLVT